MKEIMEKMMKTDSSAMDQDSAKMEVLHELRELAMSLMGDKMKGHMPPGAESLQEVSVAAPSKSGLKEGLEFAAEAVADPSRDTTEKAMGFPDSEQYADHDDMELDEIESMIEELEQKRREKMGQA